MESGDRHDLEIEAVPLVIEVAEVFRPVEAPGFVARLKPRLGHLSSETTAGVAAPAQHL